MITSTKKGFTLIELLVVIAIIGLLSAVVLASLATARKKGQDSAVKEQLASFRSQAALFASNYADYSYVNGVSAGANASGRWVGLTKAGASIAGGAGASAAQPHNFCVDTSMSKFLMKAASFNGGLVYCSTGVNAASYAVWAPLATNPGSSFCMDSRGYAGVIAGTGGATQQGADSSNVPNGLPVSCN